MAPHSSTLAWKIPWTEEPGRLQSMGSLRVRQDWETSLSLFTFTHQRRKWQPTPVFLPGESQGPGAWWAAVYGVAQNRTRLKWLSSSSSRYSIFTMSPGSRFFLLFSPAINCISLAVTPWQLMHGHCSLKHHILMLAPWLKDGKEAKKKNEGLPYQSSFLTRSISSLRQLLADFTLRLTGCDWFA